MADLILRQDDIDRFTTILDKLTKQTRVSLVVLVHRDGHLLASGGESDSHDTTALSALVSANFSSTVAIANLIGEKEFTIQHHAGKEKSILVSLIDDYTFLVSVFGLQVPIEPIHVYTDECRDDLLKALNKLYNNEADGFLPSGDDFEAGPTDSAPEEEIVDAEEALRRQKDGEAGGVVPRRLSYTTRPPKGQTSDGEERKGGGRHRVIREPDAGDADLEALANAISSKSERDKKPTSDSKGEGEVMVIDGKPMNIVSLKSKKKK